MTTFDADRKGTGTKEWAEINENIAKGCSHNCLYCYSAANAKRFKLRERADWSHEELTKRAFITSYPKRNGIIMFPTTHDITACTVEPSIRVLRLMLAAGNEVLIVSKPHYEYIERLCGDLAEFKDALMFRFTIGTMDEGVAKHWEPGAPAPVERVASLKLAFEAGFRTSVSAEPLLGGFDTAQSVLDAVGPYVTDTVWIGKLNRIRTRVDISVPENLRRVIEIEEAQSDAEVRRIFNALDGHPLVRWKDSVTEVMARPLAELLA